MPRTLAATLLTLLFCPLAANAQESASLAAGSTVRVRAWGGIDLLGEVEHLVADSIVVSTDTRGRVAVPYGIVQRIEVWRPRASAFTGARRGLFVGIATGFALSAANAVLSSGDVPVDRGIYFIGGSLVGGSLFGALALRAPHWQQISVPR